MTDLPPTPHILFVFLDGIGLGAPGPDNPLDDGTLETFARLAGGQPWTAEAAPLAEPGHVFRAVDANLGVEGLPQSGTGQAALLTGMNAAEAAGRHFGPYPHSKTRALIREHNLFARVQALDGRPRRAAFLNAYPPRFFEMMRKRDRWTVTTRSALDAGLALNDTQAVREDRGLTADLTREVWQQFDPGIAPITEGGAGRLALRLARRHDLSLFEYFLTDKAGHAQDSGRARAVLHSLDAFFAGILDDLDPARELLVVCSDHGNLEDLSTRSHTRNAVPLVAYGAGAQALAQARSILDVTPAIAAVLSGRP